MVSPSFEETKEITKKGEWIHAVAEHLGATVNESYYWLWKVQETAKSLIWKFFPELLKEFADQPVRFKKLKKMVTVNA